MVGQHRASAEPLTGRHNLMPADNPFQSPSIVGSASSPITRPPWLRRSFALGVLGLFVTFVGFLYGALLVGVPYPDATPEMIRREAFHLAVSDWGMAIGGCLTLCGMVALMLVLIAREISRIST